MYSPAAYHRRLKTEQQKMQPGRIVSFTTLSNPPPEFGHHPRTIALIELADGSRVMGVIAEGSAFIGAEVTPRMRLSHVTDEALRIYEVAYAVTSKKPVTTLASFPGYILALTGPSGVGKTTISRKLVHAFAAQTQNVPILTTRSKRSGDDGEYQYISKKEFTALQKRGEIVSAVEIPSSTGDRFYGYRASDIEVIWKAGKVPVVITEMHLLQGLSEHYGRRSLLSFGLLPPGRSKRAMLSALLHRLRSRGADSEESIRDRLENAERDLAFFRERKDLFDHLITNDDLDSVMAMFKQKVPALQEA